MNDWLKTTHYTTTCRTRLALVLLLVFTSRVQGTKPSGSAAMSDIAYFMACSELEPHICPGGMFQAVKRIFTTSVWWFEHFLHFWYSTKQWEMVQCDIFFWWVETTNWYISEPCLQPAGLKTKTSPPIPIKRCYVLRGLAHDTKTTVAWRASDPFWFFIRGFAISE